MPDSLASTVDTTRRLLDGAIAAAERDVAPRPAPPMTTTRWAWHLVSQWHSAHHSLALLGEVIDRFSCAGRNDLARFASHKLAEEDGHDELFLADLQALGFDAAAVVGAVAPAPAVKTALDYARETVRGARPVTFLGYIYAMERRVIRIPASWFAELEAQLPAGVNATWGLRTHATEFDHGHVEEAVKFVSALPARDRSSIALGAYRITQIRCAGHAGPQPDEAELETELGPFLRRHHAVSAASKPYT
jgi:hypothetical protein